MHTRPTPRVRRCAQGVALVLNLLLARRPQALFHALLSSPAWPVRAAALDSLVRYSRTSAVHGSFLGLIPPACMASPSAASPAFAAALKAHMARAPDDGARRAHGEWLAAGGPSCLARRLASRGGAGAGPGATAPIPAGLEPLLRGCLEQRQAAAAHLAQLESSVAPLAAEAKAALAGVTQSLSGAEAAVGACSPRRAARGRCRPTSARCWRRRRGSCWATSPAWRAGCGACGTRSRRRASNGQAARRSDGQRATWLWARDGVRVTAFGCSHKAGASHQRAQAHVPRRVRRAAAASGRQTTAGDTCSPVKSGSLGLPCMLSRVANTAKTGLHALAQTRPRSTQRALSGARKAEDELRMLGGRFDPAKWCEWAPDRVHARCPAYWPTADGAFANALPQTHDAARRWPPRRPIAALAAPPAR